jgi:hypothetical protein
MTDHVPPIRKNRVTRGPWQALVRAIWLVTALIAFSIFVLALPGYLRLFGEPLRIQASAAFIATFTLIGLLASLLAAALSLALAVVLYWRKPNDKMAVFISFFLLAYGIIMAGPLERLRLVQPQLAAPVILFQELTFTTLFTALFGLFPNGRFVPGWMRWVTLGSLGFIPLYFYIPCCNFSNVNLWAVVGLAFGWVVLMLLVAYAQIYRFRYVSTPGERQQTKWVVYGLSLFLFWNMISAVPFMLGQNQPSDALRPWWTPILSAMWWLVVTILPLSLTIAILRHRLFDIDIIIRRTLVYSALTALLALVYFGSVVLLQSLFRALTGQAARSQLAIVLSTLAIAALFVPLRHRLQDAIDRRFYRKKYDAAKTLADFAATVRDETDLDKLTQQLIRVVDETMQPKRVSLWILPPDEQRTQDTKAGDTKE